MMRLSTKGRYGARMMLELAIHYGKGPVLLKDISKSQEISEGYLVHILSPLKAAGLINSSRSAHGGYTLARTPADITLGEVVQTVEGRVALAECVTTPDVCERADNCVTRDIWDEVSEKVMEMLDSITLQDMVNRQARKKDSVMFSI
jgi:Rrf2 family protein